MFRHYITPLFALTLPGALALGGCNPRQPNEKATGAVSDSAAATSTESSSLARKVGEVGEPPEPRVRPLRQGSQRLVRLQRQR